MFRASRVQDKHEIRGVAERSCTSVVDSNGCREPNDRENGLSECEGISSVHSPIHVDAFVVCVWMAGDPVCVRSGMISCGTGCRKSREREMARQQGSESNIGQFLMLSVCICVCTRAGEANAATMLWQCFNMKRCSYREEWIGEAA